MSFWSSAEDAQTDYVMAVNGMKCVTQYDSVMAS